jgi:hypothetical protein
MKQQPSKMTILDYSTLALTGTAIAAYASTFGMPITFVLGCTFLYTYNLRKFLYDGETLKEASKMAIGFTSLKMMYITAALLAGNGVAFLTQAANITSPLLTAALPYLGGLAAGWYTVEFGTSSTLTFPLTNLYIGLGSLYFNSTPVAFGACVAMCCVKNASLILNGHEYRKPIDTALQCPPIYNPIELTVLLSTGLATSLAASAALSTTALCLAIEVSPIIVNSIAYTLGAYIIHKVESGPRRQ